MSWIIFVCGTNTTHEWTMCRVLFPGEEGKRSRSLGQFDFLRFDRGFLVDHRSIISC